MIELPDGYGDGNDYGDAFGGGHGYGCYYGYGYGYSTGCGDGYAKDHSESYKRGPSSDYPYNLLVSAA